MSGSARGSIAAGCIAAVLLVTACSATGGADKVDAGVPTSPVATATAATSPPVTVKSPFIWGPTRARILKIQPGTISRPLGRATNKPKSGSTSSSGQDSDQPEMLPSWVTCPTKVVAPSVGSYLRQPHASLSHSPSLSAPSI